MAVEIERKFLLKTENLEFLEGCRSLPVIQGYLHENGMTSRVRIMGKRGFLTLKGKAKGCSRPEFEYSIPLVDAKELLSTHVQSELVTKVRYYVPHEGLTWEVDVFKGKYDGLVVAEIELNSENQAFSKPSWVGEEVTDMKSLTNKSLAFSKRRLDKELFFTVMN